MAIPRAQSILGSYIMCPISMDDGYVSDHASFIYRTYETTTFSDYFNVTRSVTDKPYTF